MTEHVTDEVLLGEMQLADNQLRLGAPFFRHTHLWRNSETPSPSSSLPGSVLNLENAALPSQSLYRQFTTFPFSWLYIRSAYDFYLHLLF